MAKKKAGEADKPKSARRLSPTKALLKAAEEGDLEGARNALAAGADLAARDRNGMGAIHYACNHPEILRAVLDAGADPEMSMVDPANPSDEGGSAVHMWGPVESMRMLVAAGADINGVGFNANRAIHTAAYEGNLERLQVLLDVGADLQAKNDKGQTALHVAAERFQGEMILALVRAGADLHATDARGQTPLEAHRFVGPSLSLELIEVRRELARMGHLDGRVAELVEAADRGDLEAVRALIASGVDLDAQEYLPRRESVTALYVAAAGGHAEVASALLAAGAGVDVRIKVDFLVPRDPARHDMEPLDIGRMVLDEVAGFLGGRRTGLAPSPVKGPPRPAQVRNATPLIGAAWKGHAGLIPILAEAGADLEARPEPGEKTPLMYAALLGHPDVVRALLDAGADVNAATDRETFAFHGMTALAFARKAEHEAVVEILTGAGGVELDLEARKATWKGEPSILNVPH